MIDEYSNEDLFIFCEWLCTNCGTMISSLPGTGVCRLCERPLIVNRHAKYRYSDLSLKQQKTLTGIRPRTFNYIFMTCLDHNKEIKIVINDYKFENHENSVSEIRRDQINLHNIEKFILQHFGRKELFGEDED